MKKKRQKENRIPLVEIFLPNIIINRKEFKQLLLSIGMYGEVFRPLVQRSPKGSFYKYTIVDGNMRIAALKKLGKKTVSVVFADKE